MFLNEEFIHVYDELSEINATPNLLTESAVPKYISKIINSHKFFKNTIALDEAFDNEEVYGEAAKTIPGVLRYFVDNINTLAAIIERGRILASTGESEEASGDRVYGTKKPFVSFSHQLFSHAYRRNNKWKFGIALDQKKLEEKVSKLTDARVQDNFVHQGKSMRVFGAAKLADGSELIITSFGAFEINLSDAQRKALKNTTKTDYYEKVKNSFNTHLTLKREKYADRHAKVISEESFSCTEVPEIIKKYLKTDVDIIEGFLLITRLSATGVQFTDICKDVPGLFDYLQDHTKLNEGELRVWLPKGQKYLDVSSCIVGIVLPSNYKENNYDNEQNTAPDVLWLRKLVKEKALTIYVYKSKDETNIPNVEYVKKWSKTLVKPSIIEYFHEITGSKDAIINFIKNELGRYNKSSSSTNYSIFYNAAVARNTTSEGLDVRLAKLYNYSAFVEAINEFGFNRKDIESLVKTGQPLQNAQEAFNEKIKSVEDVHVFLKLLGKEYPNMQIAKAYCTWFANNTNAHRPKETVLKPDNVSWKYFTELCKKQFNYTARDLTAISKEMNPAINNRDSIKSLFKKAAKTSKKATLEFIKLFAEEAVMHAYPSMALAYVQYMGKLATDTSYHFLKNNTEYNYKAWLEKVTDSDGPVKLTKEEISKYYREYKTSASMTNSND